MKRYRGAARAIWQYLKDPENTLKRKQMEDALRLLSDREVTAIWLTILVSGCLILISAIRGCVM